MKIKIKRCSVGAAFKSWYRNKIKNEYTIDHTGTMHYYIKRKGKPGIFPILMMDAKITKHDNPNIG